jgi:hypothetical protein
MSTQLFNTNANADAKQFSSSVKSFTTSSAAARFGISWIVNRGKNGKKTTLAPGIPDIDVEIAGTLYVQQLQLQNEDLAAIITQQRADIDQLRIELDQLTGGN